MFGPQYTHAPWAWTVATANSRARHTVAVERCILSPRLGWISGDSESNGGSRGRQEEQYVVQSVVCEVWVTDQLPV